MDTGQARLTEALVASGGANAEDTRGFAIGEVATIADVTGRPAVVDV